MYHDLEQRGKNLPQSPSFTALLSAAHGVLLFFLAAYFFSASSEWDGSRSVESQDKLRWYAAMVELIHKPGGSTRSNLGWKIADEFFSNKEDLGNYIFLDKHIIIYQLNAAAQALGFCRPARRGWHGYEAGFKEEMF